MASERKGKGPAIKRETGLLGICLATSAATLFEILVISPDDPARAFAGVLLASLIATAAAAYFWRQGAAIGWIVFHHPSDTALQPSIMSPVSL